MHAGCGWCHGRAGIEGKQQMDEFDDHGGVHFCLSILIFCNPSLQMLPPKVLCLVMRLRSLFDVLNNHMAGWDGIRSVIMIVKDNKPESGNGG